MKIDSHQHFWQYDRQKHDWITDEMAVLKRDFLPGDLSPLLTGCGLDGCVAVQADQSMEETLFLLELTRHHDFIKGVVGWVDLRSPHLENSLKELSRHEKLVGFRHVLQGEPEGFMLQPDFVRGVEELSRLGYTYDILVYAHQLPEVVQLLDRLPEMPLVIDHFAKPDIKSGSISQWKENMEQIAQHQHVVVKMSGLVTEADWKGWHPEDMEQYFEVVLQHFGAGRILYGSDWPVCTLAGDYQRVYDLAGHLIGRLGSAEQADIMGLNAARFYNLKD